MSMPIGPIWSVLHLAIKFPAAAVVVVTGYVYVSQDTVDTLPQTFTIPEINTVYRGPMIALTFDDGWRSVREIALPELNARGMVATNYITTNFVDSNPVNYITQEHVMDFVQAGWEIGAHSLNHEDLTTLDEPEVISNVFLPQMVLSDWIGYPVTTFSTPYGAFNDMTIGHAEQAYLTHVNAWSDANGMNTPDTFDPMNVHRIDTANISLEEVCTVIAGLQDNEFYSIIFTALPHYQVITTCIQMTLLHCLTALKTVVCKR
jgi:peptidoglycan/xylan/chitin deacetylase (PgdA/CDA1 family)